MQILVNEIELNSDSPYNMGISDIQKITDELYPEDYVHNLEDLLVLMLKEIKELRAKKK